MNLESFNKDDLLKRAHEIGAATCGIAACTPVADKVRRTLLNWLGSKYHASMGYMERNIDLRFNPDRLLPGAKSVISFAFPYFHPDAPGSSDATFARYALGDDYHDILRTRLSHIAKWIEDTLNASTRICVDTAPVLERYWAVQAGIGFRGLNGMIIVPGVGSWVLLAEILTTAILPPDTPDTRSCGACRRCIDACPGQALRHDATVDARRCRSFLTIESRDETLPEGVNLGQRIFGCDICQEVCPWNSNPAHTSIEEFFPRPEILSLSRRDILEMDTERFSFIFRKSAVRRTKLSGLRRNILAQ